MAEIDDRSVNSTSEEVVRDHPLTADRVWQVLAKRSFAVISYVTPSGDPRATGVLYRVHDRRFYVAVAPDSWKARHIAVARRAAMTVPLRRGGLMSLLAPIPPATVSAHGRAEVHPPGSIEIPEDLEPLLPPKNRDSLCLIEIVPEGHFVTYGVDVPLMQMRTPARSRSRVPV